MKPIKSVKPKLTIHRETLRKLSADALAQVAGGTATRACTNTYEDCPPGATSECTLLSNHCYGETHVEFGLGACNTQTVAGNG
jgi:hypothetical protein